MVEFRKTAWREFCAIPKANRKKSEELASGQSVVLGRRVAILQADADDPVDIVGLCLMWTD